MADVEKKLKESIAGGRCWGKAWLSGPLSPISHTAERKTKLVYELSGNQLNKRNILL